MIFGRMIRSPSKYAMPLKNAHGNHPKKQDDTKDFQVPKMGGILTEPFCWLFWEWVFRYIRRIIQTVSIGTNEMCGEFSFRKKNTGGLGKLVKKQRFHLDSWNCRMCRCWVGKMPQGDATCPNLITMMITET